VTQPGTFIGRYRAEYAGEKQLQSDGNMPALPDQELTRLRREPMNIDFLPAAASRPAAIGTVHHNRARVEPDSVSQMPFPLQNVCAQNHDDQAAGYA
jgi:hypothetical protein